MKTEILKIDSNNIDKHAIHYAAEVLKNGGLVVFPTETVYGLGAHALDEHAVKSIFTAKGRPSDNPLIVHVAGKADVYGLVADMPPDALKLMDAFWPGPLTLVMKKTSVVPQAVTAGLDTVAVRMPSHPVAMALLEMAAIPVAAPSANTSGKPSPTCAEHVIDDLFGKVDVIIDAGKTYVGLESTVFDISVTPPLVLRPGGITLEQLMQYLPNACMDPSILKGNLSVCNPKSPGIKYTHYSPRAPVIIVEAKELYIMVDKVGELAEEHALKGEHVGILATDQTINHYPGKFTAISTGSRLQPQTIASNLFNALREFDKTKVDIIIAEAIDDSGMGAAVMNRLKKAAGYNIVKA